MKKIIDANYFQAPELETYLSSSKANFVVFCDFASFEAYKGNALKSIFKSIEIVSNFPDQVIVLKSTREVVSLTLTSNNPFLLEEREQTEGFRDFCLGVRLAISGNEELKGQIIEKGIKASELSVTFRDNAAKIAGGIVELTKSFKIGHLQAIKKRGIYPADLCDKVIKDILLVSALLFSKYSSINHIPQAAQLRNSFAFRLAICAYILALRWISDGGPATVSMDKLNNDIVDMHYIAYATYFDGLLSRDRKMNEIYGDTCYMLANAFGKGSNNEP
jgi:hypothetical protein